jgi:hypothetical protein
MKLLTPEFDRASGSGNDPWVCNNGYQEDRRGFPWKHQGMQH